MKKIIFIKDVYYDSVFLMLASRSAKEIQGVFETFAAMGTTSNVELLADIGFEDKKLSDVQPNDLMIAVDAESKAIIDDAVDAVNDFISKKGSFIDEEDSYQPVSLGNAMRMTPASNLIIISTPGIYAAREARLALNHGLHVMLFSDNVSVNDEIQLKQLATRHGLLMMGPDCGTAIINGKPLCFANRVRRGDIGVVAASGSGLQEVTCCAHNLGFGISQAIGTGGRDLKDKQVGGLMMKMGIQALSVDDNTSVIVVISKPPEEELSIEIINTLKTSGKPCVVHFLGQDTKENTDNIFFADTLEHAAQLATTHSGKRLETVNTFAPTPVDIQKIATSEIEKLHPKQQFLRGLYAGGTLADEAIFGLQRELVTIYSNIHPDSSFLLSDPNVSQKHTIVDLGDDSFTVGRPHPMIDPSIREERFEKEIADPKLAVLLMDFVLGKGAHEDPVGHMVEYLQLARHLDKTMGRHLSIVTSITGTDKDFQNISKQKELLEEYDCIVMASNHQAVQVATAIIKGVM